MAFLFERDTGRSVKLRDDDALSSIDDKRPFFCHHGNRSHVDFFFLDTRFVSQPELYLKGDIVSNSAADALFGSVFGHSEVIRDILENCLLVIRFDRKYLSKDLLQSDVFSLMRHLVRLEKLVIGFDLDFNEVRQVDNLFSATKTHPLRRPF